MERQRLAEWEKQRKAELVQHRQREQEKVLELKAKKENLDSEFEKMVGFIYEHKTVATSRLKIMVCVIGSSIITDFFINIARQCAEAN